MLALHGCVQPTLAPSIDAAMARVLDRMAPDDAADLLGELDQSRRLPVLNHMSASQQHKLRNVRDKLPQRLGGPDGPLRFERTGIEALIRDSRLGDHSRE